MSQKIQVVLARDLYPESLPGDEPEPMRVDRVSVHQTGILRVAPTTGKGHFAAVGRQPAGTQGQDQLGVLAAGDRQQHRGLGETRVDLQILWREAAHTLEQLVQHGKSLIAYRRHHGTKERPAQACRLVSKAARRLLDAARESQYRATRKLASEQ